MIPLEIIHHTVKHKIKEGPANTGSPNQRAGQLVNFQRAFGEVILSNYFNPLSFSQSDHYLGLADIFISAWLTEVFQAGNCGEHAKLGYMEYLKAGGYNSLELICVDGLDAHQQPAGHAFVLLNRPADAPLNAPAAWKNVSILDAYHNSQSYQTGPNGTDFEPLVKDTPINQVTHITSKARLERELTPSEWSHVIRFFTSLRNFLTVDNYQSILQKLWDNYTTSPLEEASDTDDNEQTEAVLLTEQQEDVANFHHHLNQYIRQLGAITHYTTSALQAFGFMGANNTRLQPQTPIFNLDAPADQPMFSIHPQCQLHFSI